MNPNLKDFYRANLENIERMWQDHLYEQRFSQWEKTPDESVAAFWKYVEQLYTQQLDMLHG